MIKKKKLIKAGKKLGKAGKKLGKKATLKLQQLPPRQAEDERRHEREIIADLTAQGRLEDGIVFCGGGAKGAFELGVWKYLEERGLAGRFTGVSGASVGALNTLLFVQGTTPRPKPFGCRWRTAI